MPKHSSLFRGSGAPRTHCLSSDAPLYPYTLPQGNHLKTAMATPDQVPQTITERGKMHCLSQRWVRPSLLPLLAQEAALGLGVGSGSASPSSEKPNQAFSDSCRCPLPPRSRSRFASLQPPSGPSTPCPQHNPGMS